MTGYRPSRTAVLMCQGRAAAQGRIAPGRFADPTAMTLLRSEEQKPVHLVRDEQPPADGKDRMAYDMVRGCAEIIVPRTVAIDDAVRAAASPQLVLLGAGLDGRAWRLAADGVTVFEVDQPASQRDKRDRAAALPAGGTPHYVPVDFARDRLADALGDAGHDPAAPTTWVWEGVVPYLTRGDVEATVAALTGRSAAGTRLIVNYQTPSLRAGLHRLLLHAVTRVARRPHPAAGEPRRSDWRPAAMAQLLARHGFGVTADADLLTLAATVPSPTTHATSLRLGRVLIADR
jgi:methyltransferase (TIGR00027 family)